MMSACAVMCSDCPAYLGAAKGIEHRSRTVDAWHRIYGLDETVEHLSCGGCLGPGEALFYTSRDCEARRCCLSRELASCAECPVQPCEKLEKAQSVWDGVPNLVDKLSASDFAAYALPYCDHRARLAAARAAFQNRR
jgi:hypothetical protein